MMKHELSQEQPLDIAESSTDMGLDLEVSFPAGMWAPTESRSLSPEEARAWGDDLTTYPVWTQEKHALVQIEYKSWSIYIDGWNHEKGTPRHFFSCFRDMDLSLLKRSLRAACWLNAMKLAELPDTVVVPETLAPYLPAWVRINPYTVPTEEGKGSGQWLVHSAQRALRSQAARILSVCYKLVEGKINGEPYTMPEDLSLVLHCSPI